MAKVIMSWTRDDISKDWLIPNRQTIDTGVFTKEEADILFQTKDVYASLPGYVTSALEFLNDYTYTFTIEFDTQQAAESAYDTIKNPVVNSPFYLRQQLMNLKRNQLGLNYTFAIELA